MKLLFKLLLFAMVLPTVSHAEDERNIYLVRAVVEESKLILSPSSEGQAVAGNPPVYHAILRIDKVLKGPESLIGTKMNALSGDKARGGNSLIITPRLKIGNVGLMAIKSLADGSLSNLPYFYRVQGSKLPLIQGRDHEYESILQRLLQAQGDANSVDELQQQLSRDLR